MIVELTRSSPSAVVDLGPLGAEAEVLMGRMSAEQLKG